LTFRFATPAGEPEAKARPAGREGEVDQEGDDPEEEASLRAHLAWLDEAIARADAVLRALIKANEELRRCERRIRTVPGVGPVTAATLLALMPELGRRSAKTVAALAGLAPYARESGRFKGARSVQGGRKTELLPEFRTVTEAMM